MSHKILLIDDDSDDREFFLDAVSKISAEISCTVRENCTTLISDLTSNTLERPHVIFLDINMPEMSGWDCLSALKSSPEFADVPVLMYSTSDHREEAAKAQRAGAVGFFTKPYDLKELKENLEQVINHLDRNSLSDLKQNSDRFY